ncbi:MAG: cystathionine gamma-synthase [Spirochaetes bacterium RIFOXYB1_FULL_32_8]|nr:MAG: cystathionine gamma-synthase [Spirochaetes bacterium GWE1_32_154]OHD51149.1 MAG: cystathionine gamma-synthase [Spirochaetes bacterium GWE2_31_10]OHD80856.1 MAG: cystathionine gamma-synthase [Spirochaetes bacterium RIFOXYB1_FULL_32_8]
MNIDTLLVRSGMLHDSKTGAISMPIYQSATFAHPEIGMSTGFDYSRTSNPTRKALEDTMALLEKGDKGFAFSSGMAALTAVFMLFPAGSHILVSDDIYGGTYRLFEVIYKTLGLQFSYIDTSNIETIEKNFKPGITKAIFVETPTNPMMKITDLRLISTFAQEKGIISIADNTFMTPCFQRPIELGINIVAHSGTKYLSGHNDTLSGFVITDSPQLSEKIGMIQNTTGGVLAPFDSWLMLRSLKTLSIRMKKIEENAHTIASYLDSHTAVTQVFYPGFKNHPGYTIHTSQSSGNGGIISFYTDNYQRAFDVIRKVSIITFAESLGGVESLITYPKTQTHAAIPEKIQLRSGITDCLVRLSVGIEDIHDLINDLNQALS